ncbi:hypothetical protein KM043_013260 [Ampulex compressa]|nr:hypothetical protein KM043_013260 [Ampulex compressa]
MCRALPNANTPDVKCEGPYTAGIIVLAWYSASKGFNCDHEEKKGAVGGGPEAMIDAGEQREPRKSILPAALAIHPRCFPPRRAVGGRHPTAWGHLFTSMRLVHFMGGHDFRP